MFRFKMQITIFAYTFRAFSNIRMKQKNIDSFHFQHADIVFCLQVNIQRFPKE